MVPTILNVYANTHINNIVWQIENVHERNVLTVMGSLVLGLVHVDLNLQIM